MKGKKKLKTAVFKFIKNWFKVLGLLICILVGMAIIRYIITELFTGDIWMYTWACLILIASLICAAIWD